MAHVDITEQIVQGLATIEIVYFLLLTAFYVVFFYKLYKIFKVGEDYDLPKIVLSSILGILLYGFTLIVFVAEAPHLELSYIVLFKFTSGIFIFFFIFIFIDLFIGMKRFNEANKMAANNTPYMLQRSFK